jgi:type I restriction enzyme S subunit
MTEVRLGDALELIIDHRGKTPKKLGGDFTDFGVPVVSAIHIKDGIIQWSERERYVSPQMFAKWMPQRLKKGDVLLTSEAPLGQTALVPSNDDLVLSQRLFALRGKKGVLDSSYLRYFLASEVGQRRLHDRATGTTVVGIRQSELVRVLIPLPSLDEQRKIAGVLVALDDLIQANRELIRDLDALFHAEWDRRFGMPAPSEAKVPLASITTTQYGYTDAATSDPAGPRFLRVADINKANWVEWASVPYCSIDARKGDKYRLLKGDIVVARMADPGRSARVETEVDAVFASYLVRVRPTDRELDLYLFGYFKSVSYRDYALSAMTGSVQKNMNAKIIVGTSIVVPNSSDIKDFNDFGTPIRDAIAALVAENQQLTMARDELLQLLLSGRVRVDDLVA